MAINGLTTGTGMNVPSVNYEAHSEVAETKQKTAAAETDAVVYEKSSDSDKEKTNTSTRKVDQETIDRLKAEAEERTAQMRGLVEKLLLKQAGTASNAEGLANVFRKLQVDKETIEQAKADVAEDGYFGVEQTSDRIVSFAKALAGDDKELAGQMMDAFKEGYKQARDAWGEELPEISQKTYDKTLEKMQEWIDGLAG